MEEPGGRCDLVVHKDGVHGSLFHPNFYQRTRDEMDGIFIGLDYLDATQG